MPSRTIREPIIIGHSESRREGLNGMSESVVGPWAADKLDRLGKYLGAYTTIMRKQKWCEGYHYIDAFAGPGRHSIRSEKRAYNTVQRVVEEIASFGRDAEEQ